MSPIQENAEMDESQIQTISLEDLSRIWTWNAEIASTHTHTSVCDIFSEMVKEHSAAEAVCAWDGTLTYAELDSFSTILSRYLIDQGVVKPGCIVPLCFEKSMWVPVAILAVMKAGSASVLLDVVQPEERLRKIVQSVGTTIILSSTRKQSLSADLSENTTIQTITVDHESLRNYTQKVDKNLSLTSFPSITADSPLYVVYTSGSTGQPKGAVITHGNFCASVEHHRDALKISSKSRFFDHTSYAFDVTWGNNLHPLTSGGCVCIPSEDDRSSPEDISRSFAQLRANTMQTTPTVARLLDPNTLPGLQTLISLGEPLTRADIVRWKEKRDMCYINAYGPAEHTILATAQEVNHLAELSADPSIGHGIGAVCWILQEDGKTLAPIGSVGELYLEGPLVGKGYFNDEEKTKAVFLEDPEWLVNGVPELNIPGRRGRVYKTGDMVRYDQDGSLTTLGRRDTQVKINGQRVELGEIEHHIMEADVEKAMAAVVVEMVTPSETGTPTLALFFTLATDYDGEELVEKAESLFTILQDALIGRVARYMIPTAYMQLQMIPTTPSGKTDRKRLRELGSSIQRGNMRASFTSRDDFIEPTTDIEKALQSLWATTLNLPDAACISVNDHFLRLGGDSIMAMKLVSAAHGNGISITVQEIFKLGTLQALAGAADAKQRAAALSGTAPIPLESSIAPFSLLIDGIDVHEARENAAFMCGIDSGDIEDIFPCTPLQEGLMAQTAMTPGRYVSSAAAELLPRIDISRLQKAWQEVVNKGPILRTRIIALPAQGLVQIVTKPHPIQWLIADSLEAYRKNDADVESIGLGTELTRFGIVQDELKGKSLLMLTQHHALYDGWSLRLLQSAVEAAYSNFSTTPFTDFQPFVHHLKSLEISQVEAYWRTQYEGFNAAPFPAVPEVGYEVNANKAFSHKIENIDWSVLSSKGITASSALRTSWAVLMSWLSGNPDSVFGAIVLGRQAPVAGIETLVAPTIATVPVRIRINDEASVMQILQTVQNQSTEMIAFEQTGLQHIRRISHETDLACQFQSLLIVQPAKDDENSATSNVFARDIDDEEDGSDASNGDSFNSHALTLECILGPAGVVLKVFYDSQVMPEKEVDSLCWNFGYLLHQLTDAAFDLDSTRVSDLSQANDTDLAKIWTWNKEPVEPVEACIHELIAKRVLENPNAPAIAARDGHLTYGELDAISNKLAMELIRHGVKPGVIVPLMFHKSVWVPVSKLAVMKAGGASVTVDLGQPEERLRNIVQQSGSIIVLHESNPRELSSIVDGIPLFEVSYATVPDLPDTPEPLPVVKPSDLLYLVFTSGSTGTPKGVMITHSNFASAHVTQANALKFEPTSRVADFASYAFDVSWANFLNTLCSGGCLCIPSEEDRQGDMIKFMNEFEITYLDITPSVAALLDVKAVPTLQTMSVGGELVELDKLNDAMKSLKSLIVAYGPAECSVSAAYADAIAAVPSGGLPLASIGNGLGCVTWIVEEDMKSLTPIGSVGELVLEGPIVGAGYMNNTEKTTASFIVDTPEWLSKGYPAARISGRTGPTRLYRTGDLCKYHTDGSLIFLGRKDSQVKLRGQRIDLSEVEFYTRQGLTDDVAGLQIVTEVITPNGSNTPVLVTFFNIAGVSSLNEMQILFSPSIGRVKASLEKHLPKFMHPAAYVPIQAIPLNASQKTDRKVIRAYGSTLEAQDIYSRSETLAPQPEREHKEPTTKMQSDLRELWSQVLGISAARISIDDTFMQHGGDSIAAMRLVATARPQDLTLSVTQILKHPRLQDMAHVLEEASLQGEEVAIEEPQTIIKPFSLLKPGMSVSQILQTSARACNVDATEIEDVFPCTALQEGLFAMTLRKTGDYVQRTILELKPDVDISRFQVAWARVYEMAPILRTRIIELEGQGMVQVVLRDSLPIEWNFSGSIDNYQEEETRNEENRLSMSMGTPLNTFGLINDTDTGKVYFAWTQQHATYDGWSVNLIYDAFDKLYNNGPGSVGNNPFSPLQPFVKHAIQNSQSEKAKDFWKKQFTDLDAPQFPAIPAGHTPQADDTLEYVISGVQWPANSGLAHITRSSVLRAAWATLLSWHGASPDTAFGAVVFGRQAQIPGIEKMAGPAFATVPLRIVVDEELSVADLLNKVQDQSTDMIPFEQTGLQNIRILDDQTERGCQFQNLLVVQSSETSDESDGLPSVFIVPENGNSNGYGDDDSLKFNTYAIHLIADISETSVKLSARFDSKVITSQEMQWMAQQLDHVLKQLTANPQARIGELDQACEKDMQTIWGWNKHVPEMVEGIVHEIFAQRVQERPEAPAVCAWDGDFNYRELDILSTILAKRLVREGVKTDVIVPIYFEKSKWVIVCMMGIMKAGGAGVTFDTNLPTERLKGVATQVSPVVLLNSRLNDEKAKLVTDATTLTVDEASIQEMDAENQQHDTQLPKCSPEDLLYLVFTSGSTGAPKGAQMRHKNFCSSARHHQAALGLEPDSRIYEFTSYAFDVAWSNMLHSVTIGACLCIPSEEDRKSDIAGSIRRLRADWVHITPTVADILDPESLPELKKFLFTGEALKRSHVTRWAVNDHMKFYNTYGPAECTVTSTVDIVNPDDEREPSIGRPYGTLAWIVKTDGSALTALGAPGELWIEGPTVGAGYLNNPDKTAAAFVEDPEWLARGGAGVPGRQARLYRTGDVVRYNPDGSIYFIGRKDTQVKIRSQRIELGEIDFHVKQVLEHFPQVKQSVTEAITPEATKTVTLAAFLTLSETSTDPEQELSDIINHVKIELSKTLPIYMVPTAYIKLDDLPMTASGKTDRRALRELGKLYMPPSFMQLEDQSWPDDKLSDEENSLRTLWSSLLGINRDLIGPDHSFSGLGGDSIKIMSLVMGIRREYDLSIPMPRLLGKAQDTLQCMARLIATMSANTSINTSAISSGRDTPNTEYSTFATPGLDIDSEVQALTDLMLNSSPFPQSVFLTGSTGFLGIQILRSLIESKRFERIILLVRSSKGKKGNLERIKDAAITARWWKEEYTSLFETWEGDLGGKRLGLSDPQWSSLCGVATPEYGVVNAVIHNGAAVHWSSDYETLKAVNVGSTLQLLQAAMHSKVMNRFVYISGGMSASEWAKSAPVSPTDKMNNAASATGYDQSKYISEKLVSAAAAQKGEERSKYSIVKPGLIIGDTEHGVANPDDFLWRMVTTAVRLQAHPAEGPKSWLRISDVASISSVILHHATAKDVDHFVELEGNGMGMWVDAFWATIASELDRPLRAIPFEEWEMLAQEQMEEEKEKHPLWPVQQFLGDMGGEAPPAVERISEGVDVGAVKVKVEDAIRKNVQFLQEGNLMGARGEVWQEAIKNFGRF